MTEENLEPMPTPVTEEPELVPGGVDTVDEDPDDDGLGRDLSPEDNPAVDNVLPDAIAEPDDKQQAPDGPADDREAGTEADSPADPPAAEDGSVEPPA